MNKARFEAFSDGVIAILITIMVLELKIPHGAELSALLPLIPVLLSYVLSYVYLGIYWNNHHHMLHMTSRVNGKILWANLHLLFWLSLVPFVTGWMGENHFESVTTAVYGCVLLGAALAYVLLQNLIIADQRVQSGGKSKLEEAVGKDKKGMISAALYVAGILVSAFARHWSGALCYAVVALIWLIPDPRIEKRLVQ
jgi:uncharacterized membrane protein